MKIDEPRGLAVRTLFAMQSIRNYVMPAGVMVLGVVWPGGAAVRGDRYTTATFRRILLSEE